MEQANAGDVNGLVTYLAHHPKALSNYSFVEELISLACRGEHVPVLECVRDHLQLRQDECAAAGIWAPPSLQWSRHVAWVVILALNHEHIPILDWLHRTSPAVLRPRDMMYCTGVLGLTWMTQHVPSWRQKMSPHTIFDLVQRSLDRRRWGVLWWLKDQGVPLKQTGEACWQALQQQVAPVREILGRDVWSLVQGYM